MKYLLALIFLLPFIAHAQTDADMGQGLFYQTDCYRFMLRKFARKTGTMENLAKKYIRPETHTIYIIKTPDIDSLPKEINGYAIKIVDADSNLSMLYREQKKGAVILYFSKINNYINLYDFWIIPVKMSKKKMDFEKEGCSIRFEYNMGTSRFEHIRTECKD
jgi:hypothetical protein